MAGVHPRARMSDAESVMWRLERHDARLRPVITVVILLEASPGIDAVSRRADLLSRIEPRFRCRVVAPVTPLGDPVWQPDEAFDLGWHVRVVGAPGEGTLEDVLALAGPLAAEGLDPARPQWQMTLVEGMAGGRAALVARLHHTFTDGTGAARLATTLFDFDPDAPPRRLPPLEEPAEAGTLGSLGSAVAAEAARAVAVARSAAGMVAGLLGDALAAPEARAAEVVALTSSVARALAPAGGPCSPVMTGRSVNSVLGRLELSLDDVRGVAAAAEVTVNDVFVAAVVDGLRRYHAKHGSCPDALRLGIPISVRADGDESLENQFFPARLLAPVGVEDPHERLRAVHDLVAAQRAEPALGVLGPLAALANRAGPLLPLVAGALRSIDAVASNVVGSPDPLWLAGARLERIIPFGPRSGAGLNLTTISYDGTLHVGVNMDPAATPDTATLLACLGDAFEDVVVYA